MASRGLARRVAALAAGMLSVALVVSGCSASIPLAGDVQPGLASSSANDQSVIFTPSGPAARASAEEIVRGFTLAAASSLDDYAIARSFLTPDFARRWQPDAGVIIDETSRSSVSTSDETVELTVTPVASLDASGSLTVSAPNVYERLSFELTQVQGEWRISNAPDGLLLDRATFSLVFDQQVLYFVNPRTESLVPDARWFAADLLLPGRVVGALLEGPSASLGGVVTTGFPEGSALESDAVPIDNGVARISLNETVASADRDALALMQRQISATMAAVPGVTDAELRAGEAAFTRVRVQPADAGDFAQVSSKPVIMIGNEVGELVDVTLISLGSISRPIAALNPTALTVKNGNGAALVTNSSGLVWVLADGSTTVLDGRAGLAGAALDREDVVFSSVRTAPQQILVSRADGTRASLPAPWKAASEVSSLAVSTDGTRLAALVLTRSAGSVPSQLTVQIAGVLRDATGVPVGFTPATEVAWLQGSAVDLDWMSPTQVAVASTPSAGPTQLQTAGLGLFGQSLGSSPQVVALSGANARGELRALSDDGVVRAPQGLSWREVVKNIRLLAKRA